MKSKVAVVTGASSGLGRAIALDFGCLGWKIVCADLRPDSPSAPITTVDLINKETDGDAIWVRTDVSSSQDVQSLIDKATGTFGRLDILVNNAGISLESHGKLGPKLIADTDDSTFDTTWAVNAKSVFLGCKYAIQQFLRQAPGPTGDRGWIINIASVYGLKPEAEHVSYCATKAAVVQMTKCIAREYGSSKIHVNAICPGFIKTNMDRIMLEDKVLNASTIALHPWGTLGSVEDIAKAARFLATEQSSWITGVALPVDGGYMVA
ncbi:related to dehydrogenases with different specificities (related to short-chain alcohol dehydrogenases) [Fusarium torulosum]|uniref:Related to dehydrogenases with different specificities (Related to short-chain alcohol dehydrogenases) n=1 Tax=Fusarium torulosum TaxID=33205 RepID=A0AAE8MNA9_9HYPO|nr:related to dehydrogenases with different specificities (related to short-chain alcohol dehydrogenases) [Fusarium torulosum]